MTFTPFETARLRLRPQEARDAGFALCIWGDPITGKYLSDPVLDDIDDLNKYMELLRSLSDSTDCYYVIAEDKVTHQPIGTCCAVAQAAEQFHIFVQVPAVLWSRMAAAAGISVTASTLPAGARVMPKKW